MSSDRVALAACLVASLLAVGCEALVGIKDLPGPAPTVTGREEPKAETQPRSPAPSSAPDAGGAASAPSPASDAGAPDDASPTGPQCTQAPAPVCDLGESQRWDGIKGDYCDHECDCSPGHFCAPFDSVSGVCCKAGPCGAPCSDSCECLSLACQGGRCL